MKINVLMVALAVSMTVNAAAAQDTLKISSFRVVNVCSGEKSWLISLSLGRINFSDSLESFDIAIGYDRSVLRPTSVLKEGTLSAQMSNGPVMNTVVPNEMRIYGFNIARSVAGDLPLFAVSGDFVGTCKDVGDFSIPFRPDFNGEFKRRYTVWALDSVIAVATGVSDKGYGVVFEDRRDTITENEQVAQLGMTFRGFVKDDSSSKRIVVSLLNATDTAKIEILSAQCRGCVIKQEQPSPTSSTFTVSGPYNESSGMDVTVRRRDDEVSGLIPVVARIENDDSCSCRLPGQQDTTSILVQRPNVNVQESANDGTCTLTVSDNVIRGVCHHLQTKSLEMFDLLGQMVQKIESKTSAVEIATTDALTGTYFVVFRCNQVRTLKLIVK